MILDILLDLIRREPRLVDEPARCRAYLKDLCADPSMVREVKLLILAHGEGIPQRLAGSSPTTPINMVIEIAVRQLVNESSLQESAARWAVETWAMALGKMAVGSARPVGSIPDLPVLSVASAASRPETGIVRTLDLGSGVRMNLVYIRGGTFIMGSTKTEQDWAVSQGAKREGVDPEGPQTRVTLTDDFWMGETPVTQAQWRAVMGSDPPGLFFRGNPQNPVDGVSWSDILGEESSCRPTPQPGSFLARLSERTGVQLTLPTEAQWEYACRAGTTTRYSFGDSDSSLGDYAWYDKNSGLKTHPVKTKKPNAWRLYDMHGSVFEWCLDWDGAYPGGSVTNPTGPPSGSGRVLRSGGYYCNPWGCRSAVRLGYGPGDRFIGLGFRAVAAVQ